MNVATTFLLGAVLAAVVSIQSGCSPATPTREPEYSATSDDPPASQNADDLNAVGHVHDGVDQADVQRVKVALAKLSPENAASAEAQRHCPVSDELLGSMGAPIPIELDGKQVWLCCEGCRNPAEEEPAKILAKLETQQ